MTEKLELYGPWFRHPDGRWMDAQALTAIQNACPHKHIDERPFSIDDKDGKRHHGIMRRCTDCGMANP